MFDSEIVSAALVRERVVINEEYELGDWLNDFGSGQDAADRGRSGSELESASGARSS